MFGREGVDGLDCVVGGFCLQACPPRMTRLQASFQVYLALLQES